MQITFSPNTGSMKGCDYGYILVLALALLPTAFVHVHFSIKDRPDWCRYLTEIGVEVHTEMKLMSIVVS